MIKEYRRMTGWRLILMGLSLAAGCTKPNPRSCADGTCTDPAFPFCDVDGALAGMPDQCIAVACTPGEVDLCRGENAVTCNSEGTDYDLVRCELGCDEAVGGCRLCEPNQTACTNGTVATCDAIGTVTASEECALGCFENEARCREIDPSNNLATYLDMVSDPPDLDLSNATFETNTGKVREGIEVIDVPSFTVAHSGNGVPIRVFVVNSLRLNSASVQADGTDPRNPAGSAFAVVARKDINIRGEILVSARVGAAFSGCAPGPGSFRDDGGGRSVAMGGGGGGNATAGSSGGDVTNAAGTRGPGDAPSGTPGLVPLRGGCSGGFAYGTTGDYPTGGGAVQFSGRRIDLDAIVDVRGEAGAAEREQEYFVIGGGGAGGSLLLEAADVVLGPNTKLLATGGSGAQACATPSTYCGMGGQAATLTSPATPGMDITYTNTPGTFMTSGGGGGGLGRIRINTPDQTYTKASTTVENGSLTTGELSTR